MEYFGPGVFLLILLLIRSFIVYKKENTRVNYVSWVINEIKVKTISLDKITCVYMKSQFFNANLNVALHGLLVIFFPYDRIILISTLILILSSLITYYISDKRIKKEILSMDEKVPENQET